MSRKRRAHRERKKERERERLASGKANFADDVRHSAIFAKLCPKLGAKKNEEKDEEEVEKKECETAFKESHHIAGDCLLGQICTAAIYIKNAHQ